METLKDIFVPYEIAVQLKKIGFDEPCIAGYYLCQGVHPILDQMILNITGSNGNYDISTPTYEQVLKWFRDKRHTGYVTPLMYGYSFIIYPKSKNIITEGIKGEIGYETYEQAREALILKLIEIYENGKKDR